MDRAFRDYPAIIGGRDETDMTRDEVAKLAREEAQAVYDQNEKRYPRISSVPSWAREQVREVYEKLGLYGTGEPAEDTQIDASRTYIRMLVVIDKLLEMLENSQ